MNLKATNTIRACSIVTTFLLATGNGIAQTGFPDHCPNQAALPFAAIAVKHPVDHSCGIKGKTTSPDATQLQNSVKNNFCSSPEKPETISPQTLIDLQHHTHVKSGHGLEPTSREEVQKLGEGKVVRMKAYLIEAHHADLGAGESVNCNGGTEEDNDIHIAFGAQQSIQECNSVTAEISPHYRPASWNEIGHFERLNSSTKKYVIDSAIASRLQAHPYRITGQLFFDASHPPCPCGTACSPVRASVWEIHPVYNIEVCRSGTSCEEDNDSHWIAFDSWWKSLTPPRPAKRPHTHRLHEPRK